MKKIIITGANGFVGLHLAKELSDNDIQVLGIGGSQGSEAVPEWFYDYQVLDLTNKAETEKINFEDVDGVIHLAGRAAVGPSFDDPMGYINTNIGIEVNLFEAALSQNVFPRFLIISSGSLYDPAAGSPLSEGSSVLPGSPYAVSKLGQEQMAQYYTGRGFECIIARPFNHIGPGQGPGFIVPDLASQIVSGGEVKVGNLDAKRDYTDVRDIVRAYRLLLEKGVSGEIYNICSGRSLSGHDLLDRMTSLVDYKPTIVSDPSKMRPSDNPIIFGSHKKLTQVTGWQPIIDIETTLQDVLNDWKNK